MTIRSALSIAALLAWVCTLQAQSATEQKISRYFESIRNSPPQMLAFLLAMPKGGDLHSHLSGAVYAESYIQWAADDGLCVSLTTMVLGRPPCDAVSGQAPVSRVLSDVGLYRQLLDAWSMRSWRGSGQNGHDHFFDTFGKFGAVSSTHTGAMLAEVASRAARGHVTYLELMLTVDGGVSSRLGLQVGWDGNFQATLDKLAAAGIGSAVPVAVTYLNAVEAEKNALLKCGSPQPDPGCAVTIRYISQVSREAAMGAVFAQMVTGFALAGNASSKVVALNLVQPEDGLNSMRNFTVHMQMLDFLHAKYPSAHIALHAGELAPPLVPPEGLTFHIRESVMLGHAERIGHGISVMHENDPVGLLKEMARRQVAVEICLTSNQGILGVSGDQHQLNTYLRYGVPVVLATDDEGVNRSEISLEYLKAVEEQGLSYPQVKTIARNSLQYAFVEASEKTRLQKNLEEQFTQFERGF